jgi:glucose uptake protein GlcU
MKIDITKTIIAFNLSVIGVFFLCRFTPITKAILPIIDFVFIFIPLFFALAYKYKQTNKDKQIKKFSYLFSIIMILSNIFFYIYF